MLPHRVFQLAVHWWGNPHWLSPVPCSYLMGQQRKKVGWVVKWHPPPCNVTSSCITRSDVTVLLDALAFTQIYMVKNHEVSNE